MKLPAEFEKYQSSTPYSQGDLMTARRDSIFNILSNAKQFIETSNQPVGDATWDLYRQNVDLYREAAAGASGVCQCLAIKWLKLKMREQRQGLSGAVALHGNTRVDALRLDKALAKAAKRQALSSKKPVYTMGFEEAMKLYNVTALPGWDKQMSLKEAASLIVGKGQAHFVMGIATPRYGGNHAIAVHTQPGQGGAGKLVNVFDPNYGELVFKRDRLGSLLPRLLQACYQTGEDDVKILAELIAK